MMRKKNLLGFFPLFYWCFFFFPAHAQVTLSNILAQNINAEGAIVEIDLPMHLDQAVYVLIGWQTAEGKQTFMPQIAKGGKHIYDLRDHPLWQGQLKIVAININQVPGTVRPATLYDELNIFLSPEPLIPATINMLFPNTLFRQSWFNILLGLLVLSAIFFYLTLNKGVMVSIVLGFLVAWGAMDLRKMYDHWKIAESMESQKLTVPKVLHDLKIFLNEADRIIGNKIWKTEELGVLHLHLAEYTLADRKYALREPSQIPADFIITPTPKNREIVWKSGGYYLVKGTDP